MGPIIFAVGFWLLHIAVPRHLSLFTHRYGWSQDRPGRWNLLGLIGIAGGITCVIWAMRVHFVEAQKGWEWERTPKYLPIYLSELSLWLGWAIFYGSPAVFLGFCVAWLALHFFVVPWEERTLEAQFGEVYRE